MVRSTREYADGPAIQSNSDATFSSVLHAHDSAINHQNLRHHGLDRRNRSRQSSRLVPQIRRRDRHLHRFPRLKPTRSPSIVREYGRAVRATGREFVNEARAAASNSSVCPPRCRAPVIHLLASEEDPDDPRKKTLSWSAKADHPRLSFSTTRRKDVGGSPARTMTVFFWTRVH